MKHNEVIGTLTIDPIVVEVQAEFRAEVAELFVGRHYRKALARLERTGLDFYQARDFLAEAAMQAIEDPNRYV